MGRDPATRILMAALVTLVEKNGKSSDIPRGGTVCIPYHNLSAERPKRHLKDYRRTFH